MQAIRHHRPDVPVCEPHLGGRAVLFVGVETAGELVQEGFGGGVGGETGDGDVSGLGADEDDFDRPGETQRAEGGEEGAC